MTDLTPLSVDLYIYLIAALFPLSALMVVLQVNPYFALIMRGILGAMAALTYTVLGAPDVALTEALVGTLLAVMLYAVAVRSSLVLRVGIIEGKPPSDEILDDWKRILKNHYMQLELVPYVNVQTLNRSLIEKEIHATCIPEQETEQFFYQMRIRVPRIYEIFQAELSSSEVRLISTNLADEKNADRLVSVEEA